MTRGTVEAVPAGARKRLGALAAAGVLLTCASTVGSTPAQAATPEQLENRGLAHIIVKRAPDLSAARRADLRVDAGVSLERRLTLPDTEVVRAAPGELTEALARLAVDPDVVYAEPDAPIHAASNDSHWGDLWALENVGQTILGVQGVIDADIDAPDAWLRASGEGETVAVVDSGVVLDHPDFDGRLAVNPGEAGSRASNGLDDDRNGFVDDHRGWDWVGTANAPDDEDGLPTDTNGHGTHVTGTIAATRDNRIGVTGIAPRAKVLPLRVLDGNGSGFLSDAAEALHYAGANGYRVVNASLGLAVAPGDGATMNAVRSLQSVIAAHPGTLYVLAAGNLGADNDVKPFYPCSLPEANIVCVGASDSADRGAGFSNYGRTSVDLHAPGVSIRSTHLSGYEFMEGTSMAAPLVAGVAALVRETDPALTAAAVKLRLLEGADTKPGLSGRSVTSARLNAAAAVGPALAEPLPVRPVTGPVSPVGPPEPLTPAAPVIPPAPAPAPKPVAAPANKETSAAPRQAPALGALRLSSRSLDRSLTVTVGLRGRATLHLVVSRRLCRSGRCSHRAVRTLATPGRSGDNRIVLRRAGNGGRLKAGSYRLSVQARDGRLKSPTRTATFAVR